MAANEAFAPMEMSVMNNTDECATNETYGFEETVNPMVSWCFGLIGVIGFFGNFLVILVVLLNSQMRSTTNILILNLASADFLFVVFCIPFTAADYVVQIWPFGELWLVWASVNELRFLVRALEFGNQIQEKFRTKSNEI